MLRVGLTGGYATGKSFVGSELESLGCRLIFADKLGHDVLLPDSDGYQAAIDLLGPQIVNSDGLIDRKKVASVVFNDPQLLGRLSEIVHPLVRAREAVLVEQYRREDPNAVIVTEAAILIETGRHKTFDRLIVTACSAAVQITRAMKRDGLNREEVLERIRRQIPLEEKRRYAHYVVETDGPKENTIAQVRAIYDDLRRVAQS
jgi:dephospho-CoA kinase